MKPSTRRLLASVSPLAIAAGTALLGSSEARAANTFNVTTITYAQENFISPSTASGVTVPTANMTLVTAVGNTSDLQTGTISLTLSTGNWTSVTANAAGTVGNTNLAGSSFSTGSTAVTYTVTASTTTGGAITFGAFNLAGVGTRLSSSTSTVLVTLATTGSVNTPVTVARTIAVGTQAFTFTVPANNTSTIDLANSGSGLVFRAASNLSNVSFASLGSIASALVSSSDISGATAFTNGSSDFVRAITTGTGGLSAFSSLYLTTASCAATAPTGALTGSVSSDSRSVTFSSMVPTLTYTICGVAGGSSILAAQQLATNFSMSFVSRTVGLVSYQPGSNGTSTATNSGLLTYNGGTGTAFYVVGSGLYTSAIRVTNTSGTSGSVFVQVTPDTTGTPTRALLASTLAAGQAQFFFASDIRNAVGTSVLTDSATRATVVFLATFGSMNVNNFILNPGGVLSGGVTNSN